MKKPILVLAMFASLLTTTGAFAAINGIYLGGQLGFGDTYQSPQNAAFNARASGGSGGLAGRIFGGYQFTQYIAAEMGYTKFSNSNVTYTDYSTFFATTYRGSVPIESYAIDLVAKGTLPLQNGFSLFGKLGVAYINEFAGNVTIYNASGTHAENFYINDDTLLPTFGLGAGYDVTQNLTTDVSWMHIQHTGTSNIQSTDLVAAGVSYHFG